MTAESLPARMLGVVRSPRRTLAAVAVEPRWAGVLIVTFVVSAAAAALLLETEVGRLALLDQWERAAIALGQPVDDARYAAMQAASEHGVGYAVLSSLATGPLLALVLAAAVRVAVRPGPGAGAAYQPLLAVAAHAGVILMLRQVVAAPVIYGRETLASPFTLALFFTTVDEASPLARLLGVIDLFVVWWIVVLAIGVSAVTHRPARRIAMVCLGIYVLLATALALTVALTGDALQLSFSPVLIR